MLVASPVLNETADALQATIVTFYVWNALNVGFVISESTL